MNKDNQKNYNTEFKARTKAQALEIIKWYEDVRKSDAIRIMGKQLIRSATSVASNYRAVIMARSDRERYAKLSIVVEEADETIFWIELLRDAQYINPEKAEKLIAENTEILKVMSAYRKKYKVSTYKNL